MSRTIREDPQTSVTAAMPGPTGGDSSKVRGWLGLAHIKATAKPEEYPAHTHYWSGPRDDDDNTGLTSFGASLSETYDAVFDEATCVPKQGVSAESLRATVLAKVREFEAIDDADFEEFLVIAKDRLPVIKARYVKLGRKEADVQDFFRKFNLSQSNRRVWGCRRQYAFGKVLCSLLHTQGRTARLWSPVLGIMLLPTGGIVGAQNESILTGDMHMAVVNHACIHDAYGYAYNYHDKCGPGFNYLKTRFTAFSTGHHMACQWYGIWRNYRIMKAAGVWGKKGREAATASSAAPAP